MKFQALCKDLGFEEIPGTNTWAPDGSSVSAVGGGQKRCCRERGRMIDSRAPSSDVMLYSRLLSAFPCSPVNQMN